MTDRTLPRADYRGFVMAAFVLAVAGWAGLGYLVFNTIPGTAQLWLFFVAGVVAITGTAAPFVQYLNRRFAGHGVPAAVLLRQSLWVGFFGATCTWLHFGRTLNLSTTLLLAAGLSAIEWFLRMRERSRWEPGMDDEPA